MFQEIKRNSNRLGQQTHNINNIVVLPSIIQQPFTELLKKVYVGIKHPAISISGHKKHQLSQKLKPVVRSLRH